MIIFLETFRCDDPDDFPQASLHDLHLLILILIDDKVIQSQFCKHGFGDDCDWFGRKY